MAFNALGHFHASELFFTRILGARHNRGLKKRSSDRRRRADSRLPLRSSTCSYDKISYGCPVVLCRTAESLKANELQHAGDLPTMAILSQANSKLDDSVIFWRIPVHAVVNQTSIATSFLVAKIAEIMLSIYEVTRIGTWRLEVRQRILRADNYCY